MSKAYGLPGLRIGWIATQDKEVLGRLERYKHYLSICNSAPSERLAVIARVTSKNWMLFSHATLICLTGNIRTGAVLAIRNFWDAAGSRPFAKTLSSKKVYCFCPGIEDGIAALDKFMIRRHNVLRP